MELSSSETSCASSPEEPVWYLASASHQDDTGPSWDSVARPLADKSALQAWLDEPQDPKRKCCSLEISANTKSSDNSFLGKLWEILSSQSFESIWWGNDGNCVVIGEKLFKKEVLRRKGPRKIFQSESLTAFLVQLIFHGFRRVESGSPLLTSTEELQAVAAAGSALGKLLFYSNPVFTRDDPSYLWRGVESARKSVTSSGTGKKAELPWKRLWDVQLVAGAEEEDDDDSQPSTSTSSKPWADKPPGMGSARPSPTKRPCRHSPPGIQEAAPGSSTASLPRVTPPAPNRPLTPMAAPTFQPGQPNPGATQVHRAGLAPLCAPGFGIGMATLGPLSSHAPAHKHCPTCSCGGNTTGTGAGTRRGPDWEEQRP